jgi:hypothetical protein
VALTYSGKITKTLACPVGVWTTVVDPLDFPDAEDVHALLYVNVSGRLKAGRVSGAFDVQAVRVGTSDATCLDTRPAESETAGGAFTSFVTQPWLGDNPGGFLWQVRPRVGIASMVVTTRYSKGMD